MHVNVCAHVNGQNRQISQKTVTFNLSEPYAFTASFLDAMRVALSEKPSLRSNREWKSSSWCSFLDHIRTSIQGQKGSPHPSPQEEGHILEGNPSLQGKTVVSQPVFTPDCLGFPQGSQPSAHASGKPRHRSHAVAFPSLCSGATAARSLTGSRGDKKFNPDRIGRAKRKKREQENGF